MATTTPAAGAASPSGLLDTRPIGQVLLERGLITQDDLDRALAASRRTGERLGRVLMNAGLVRRLDLAEALAEQWGWERADLVVGGFDEALARRVDPERLVREGWFPVRRQGPDGEEVVVAFCERPAVGRCREVAGLLGARRLRLAVTTDWDVQNAVSRVFAVKLADDAAMGLSRRDPTLSALSRAADWQKDGGIVALAALLGLMAFWPWQTLAALLIVASVIFTVGIAFRFTVAAAGVGAARRRDRRGPAERVPDNELPIYTILVPVYREANIVAGLIDHLGALDYPREKLEILLLMEEDDEETIAAARAAHPPELVRFVIIPDGAPKTKPRACNVGLFFARGEFLVIYDAEDRPEPGQLRQAVAAFNEAGDDTICLQARLNYFNARENLLTRLFTLEYSYWFDYMLPGLDRLRLPIPLGGTSNHFRVPALRRLSGWDAWNVTEDADLGLRAAAEGYRVGVIDSTTYEEACGRLVPWIRQRTRWIKGYMQTTLVHTRDPLRLVRSQGPRGLVGLILLIAATPIVFMLAPLAWALSILFFIGVIWGGAPDLLPQWVELVGLLNLLVGNGVLVLLHGLAVARRRIWWLMPFALLAPAYWVLHSIASWRAGYQLIRSPFHWEKTPHGLTSMEPELGVAGHPELALAETAAEKS